MRDIHLTRRELLAAGVIASGYALGARPVHAKSIRTDSEGLTAGAIDIPVDGGVIAAYRARPDLAAEEAPILLVAHEIYGVHDYIQDVCRRFAKEGYCAIAPDLFARVGDPTQVTNPKALHRDIVMKVPDAIAMKDLDAAADWAASNGEGDGERIAINGFGWGGRAAWLYAAHSTRLKAGIAWYGRLQAMPTATRPRHPLGVVSDLKAPVLGLYGLNDPTIPKGSVKAMQTALRHHGGPSKIVVYGGSRHGFHADYRSGDFRPKSSKVAWEAALSWLAHHCRSTG